MRELQIQGYNSGIRPEYILEAPPKALAALIPAETAAPAAILSTPKSRPRLKKRWIPAIVAAAIAVTVGLNLGLYSGITAIMGTGGGIFPSGSPSAPSGSPFGDLFGSLFPFLSPETEPPFEVTIRDPDDVTEPPPPPDTRTECHSCALHIYVCNAERYVKKYQVNGKIEGKHHVYIDLFHDITAFKSIVLQKI